VLVIDFHTHMFPARVRENPSGVEEAGFAFSLMFGRGGSRMADPETMLSEMDAAGVDMAVLCAFPWMTLERCAENNDYLLEVAAAAAGMHKILFATDYPLLPYDRTLSDARAGMGGAALEADILGRNAARLFGV